MGLRRSYVMKIMPTCKDKIYKLKKNEFKVFNKPSPKAKNPKRGLSLEELFLSKGLMPTM